MKLSGDPQMAEVQASFRAVIEGLTAYVAELDEEIAAEMREATAAAQRREARAEKWRRRRWWIVGAGVVIGATPGTLIWLFS